MRVRSVATRDREQVLARLERAARLNLYLLDLALRLGEPSAGQPRGELLGAWRGDELAGVASVQPTLVLDATAEPEALEAFFPYLGTIASGLVKSSAEVVAPLFAWLENHGRHDSARSHRACLRARTGGRAALAAAARSAGSRRRDRRPGGARRGRAREPSRGRPP